jgi:hypothetical protein
LVLEKGLALLAVEVEDDIPHAQHVTPLHRYVLQNFPSVD